MYEFNRNNFFSIKKIYRATEISKLFEKKLIKTRITNDFDILDISSLKTIKKNSFLFLDQEFDAKKNNIANILFITEKEIIFNNPNFENIILVKNLNESWNILLNLIYSHEDSSDYSDEFTKIDNSYISKYAKIDASSKIYNNCVIGKGVEIGKNCIIKNNVVIKNSLVKNNVVICDNSSLGTTGFGFDFKKRGASDLNPQIGIVIIDDNVHLGSGCTIDRGKIDYTYIGKNSMIDNLVHIAHNVEIGDNACIAAQTGISGSVIIGNNVTIGGQAGFAGHLKIGDNVVVAAKSGVTKNIVDNSVVAGFPATDIKVWKKNIIRNRKNGY